MTIKQAAMVVVLTMLCAGVSLGIVLFAAHLGEKSSKATAAPDYPPLPVQKAQKTFQNLSYNPVTDAYECRDK